MLHDHFLDLDLGPIGRVVTSEDSPATAHEFFFWTAETEAAQNLDIGHIVAAEAEDATAVAVLDDPRRYPDLQSLLDDLYASDRDPPSAAPPDATPTSSPSSATFMLTIGTPRGRPSPSASRFWSSRLASSPPSTATRGRSPRVPPARGPAPSPPA